MLEKFATNLLNQSEAVMMATGISESGKRRCKFHGGRSTGPKTQAGRDAISRAQKPRWAEWRASKALKCHSIKIQMGVKMGDG